MIIDVHSHADFYGFSMNRLLKNLEENNIDLTWLLPWEAPVNEFNPCFYRQMNVDCDGPISFKKCIKYAEAAPDKFILGYAPDPRLPESIDKLHAAVEAYGVRVYGELKLRMMYDNLDAIRMFRYCGKNGLPVLLHLADSVESDCTYPRPDYWYGGGMDAFERVLRQCPETIFIGHASGFWAYMSGDYNTVDKKEYYPTGKVTPGGKVIELLRKYPNLYCDISANSGRNALIRDLKFGRSFVIEFQDKILFGRDGEMDNTHQQALISLELQQDVLDKVYSGNALKLVPLR